MNIKNVVLCLLFVSVAVSSAQASDKTTACKMSFDIKGWSAFYKVASGSGTITCDNGQTASVKIAAKGGGLTAGKTQIRDGLGKFSEVASIGEIFGTYISAS